MAANYGGGYKRPRVTSGDLRTPVTFYKEAPYDGPLPDADTPGEPIELHKGYAKIDEVYRRDVEQAKANGTLSDLTITIRDTKGQYVPSNTHYFVIDADGYRNQKYEVKGVLPNFQNRDFVDIVGSVNS